MRSFFFIALLCSSLAFAQSYSTGVPLPGLPNSTGPKTMAGSTSVTFATDQTAITVNATNPSVGLNAVAAPGSSTQIGFVDQNGTLQPFRGGPNGITVTATPVTAANGTFSRVSNSTSNQTLSVANANRKGIFLFNDNAVNNSCYVKFGATASVVSFTMKLFATDTYIMDPPTYTGQIDYLCESSSGSMEVNEL